MLRAAVADQKQSHGLAIKQVDSRCLQFERDSTQFTFILHKILECLFLNFSNRLFHW